MNLTIKQQQRIEDLNLLPDPQERQAAMDAPCHDWASKFDPCSLVVLGAAAERIDIRHRVGEIRARTLFMICTTDAVFPPNEDVTRLVKSIPAPTRYVEIDSPYGHMASGVEWKRLQPDLRWMLGDEAA